MSVISDSWAGEVTDEEAQAIAVREIPGDIIHRDRAIRNNALFYKFDIQNSDGIVMKVEIEAATGAVVDVDILKLGENGVLPASRLTMRQADEIAQAHVKEISFGNRAPKTLESEYKLRNRKLVYVFKIKRSFEMYNVTIDANTGEIVSTAEAID
ncbi:MAG: PepSY domain-containing protein [Rhodospirillales bacterium]|nr:PepSY domain-containing protein [Rhodospirillales bacterium]